MCVHNIIFGHICACFNRLFRETKSQTRTHDHAIDAQLSNYHVRGIEMVIGIKNEVLSFRDKITDQFIRNIYVHIIICGLQCKRFRFLICIVGTR